MSLERHYDSNGESPKDIQSRIFEEATNFLRSMFMMSAEYLYGHGTGFVDYYMLLYSVVRGMKAQNTFEFGTGISTEVIINALKYTGGKHISVDKRHLKDTGLSEQQEENYRGIWTYLQMNSQRLKHTFGKSFDVVLHDGSHDYGEVKKDLEFILPQMAKSSILLVHDTNNSKYMLREAVVAVVKHVRHEMITLPYSNGLTIVRIAK